ncbi:DUF6233 domain-containing protein [Streptomyces sp. NPDC005775]|uniref:DUF6233 domain-containing protein n=1 Tax=Streptomyces sp. NPDC005775 TaxID=3364729 RepID=UPI003699980A
MKTWSRPAWRCSTPMNSRQARQAKSDVRLQRLWCDIQPRQVACHLEVPRVAAAVRGPKSARAQGRRGTSAPGHRPGSHGRSSHNAHTKPRPCTAGTCSLYKGSFGSISYGDAVIALDEPEVEPCPICMPENGLPPA